MPGTVEEKNGYKKGWVLHGFEYEEAFDAEFEITDLDPEKNSSLPFNRWLDGPRLPWQTRLGMALLTVAGVVLFSWLLVSPLHLTGASNLEKASSGPAIMRSNSASSGHVQILVVHKVIYSISQDGLVRAMWVRKKYVFLLWSHYVTPSSKLLQVDHDVVYIASPYGNIIALRASDGGVLWRKKGR